MGDVAVVAGVSAQTVSRVVNDSPRVDPATRARVEAAMAQLGYRVNRTARALRTGHFRTIGVVVATLATVGNSRMLEAVAAAATRSGFGVTLVTLAGDDIGAAFSHLRQQGVDGAIVLNEATALAGADAASFATGLRVVAVDAPNVVGTPDDLVTVRSDHAGGAGSATRHLLAAGHATVWHLAGPERSFAAEERVRGWREALDAAGIPAPMLRRGDWTSAAGYAAGVEWASREDVTAVFAANDQMALGLMRAFAEAGREVGHDIHVIGFDDVADAANFRPPLTTIRQNFDALGDTAVAAIIAMIGGEPPREQVLPTTLVRRESA